MLVICLGLKKRYCLTDIFLLDFFNTLGLPTSTTVSIVFNLLGAAVVMSLIKIGTTEGQTIADIGNYINVKKFNSCWRK